MIDAEKIKRAVNDKMFPAWVDDLAAAINAELVRLYNNQADHERDICELRERQRYQDGLKEKPANEMPELAKKDIIILNNGVEFVYGGRVNLVWSEKQVDEIWRSVPNSDIDWRSYELIWSRK